MDDTVVPLIAYRGQGFFEEGVQCIKRSGYSLSLEGADFPMMVLAFSTDYGLSTFRERGRVSSTSKGGLRDFEEEEGCNPGVRIYRPPENRGVSLPAPTPSADVYRYVWCVVCNAPWGE